MDASHITKIQVVNVNNNAIGLPRADFCVKINT